MESTASKTEKMKTVLSQEVCYRSFGRVTTEGFPCHTSIQSWVSQTIYTGRENENYQCQTNHPYGRFSSNLRFVFISIVAFRCVGASSQLYSTEPILPLLCIAETDGGSLFTDSSCFKPLQPVVGNSESLIFEDFQSQAELPK